MNEPNYENWSATVQSVAELKAEERARRRSRRALMSASLAEQRRADRQAYNLYIATVDGYDRDDLGESPDY